MVAGVAGILLTAPFSLQQAVLPRPLVGLVLTVVGAVLAVRCCDWSWNPSRRATWTATLMCVVFACVTAVEGIGLMIGMATTSDTELLCHEDVPAIVIVSGQEVVHGANPYTTFNILQAERSLGCTSYNYTPLRTGPFAARTVLPSQDELDAVASAAAANHVAGGILLGFSYPAGSALAGLAGAHGVIILDALALLVAGAMVVRTSRRGTRRWFGLALCAQTGALVFIEHAHPDGIAAGLLIVACCSRRPLLGGLALGLACATKQTAWFIALPLLALAWREGPTYSLRYAGATIAGFVAVNLPFLVGNPAAWVRGVLAPQTNPEFLFGYGPVAFFESGLGKLNLVLAVLTAAMLVAVIAGTILAWRGRDGWALSGVTVASLGLWDGPRSLPMYIALMGLVAVSMCARSAQASPWRSQEPHLSRSIRDWHQGLSPTPAPAIPR